MNTDSTNNYATTGVTLAYNVERNDTAQHQHSSNWCKTNNSFDYEESPDEVDKIDEKANWLTLSQANPSIHNRTSELFVIKFAIDSYEFASLKREMVPERIDTILKIHNTNSLLLYSLKKIDPTGRRMRCVVHLMSSSIQKLASAAAQHCRILTEETSHPIGHTNVRLILPEKIVNRLSNLRHIVEDKTGVSVILKKKIFYRDEKVIQVKGSSGKVTEAIEMICNAGFTIASQWNIIPGYPYKEFDNGPDWKAMSLKEGAAWEGDGD